MSSITRSYRIRDYPNGAQRRLLDRWFGATRWLWNTALGIRSEAYRECGVSLTGNDLSRWLTQWKRTPGHKWLAEIPATVLTQCLRDLPCTPSPRVWATESSLSGTGERPLAAQSTAPPK
jgi:transposase